MAVQIPNNVLGLILHACRSSYPNEFGAVLRGEGNKIKEILLLPGTRQGRESVLYNMGMLPMASKGIGMVHSHPSGSNRPSEADLRMFAHFGNVNLIVKYPYQSISDVAAYDKVGNRLEIEAFD